MDDIVAKLRAWLTSPRGRKLSRYFLGSVICTGVSFGTLTLVYGVFRLWTQVPSTLFANLVATVPSYYLNRNWTWGRSGRGDLWREMLPFWVASIVGILASMAGAQGARDLSLDLHLHHLLSTVAVDGANVATYGVLWIAKYLFFNVLFRSDTTSAPTSPGRTEPAEQGGEVGELAELA
ncbi:GtrA family protein [Aciditerrimonas ferrireducens]|uniref:GtrA family protein n=1 Tax=Aciditerrimonas ferrireducens TaxID=667306 RepID=A0ABV6C528_9ACTN